MGKQARKVVMAAQEAGLAMHVTLNWHTPVAAQAVASRISGHTSGNNAALFIKVLVTGITRAYRAT